MEAFSAWLAIVFVVFLLTGKPGHPALKETAILLPEADGKSSGIVIESKGQRSVVSEPYQGIELSGGKATARQYSAAEVQRLFPEVMQALPQKPRSFTLRFESSGTTLTAESSAMLEDIGQEIARHDAPEITVVGHTDREGSAEDNLRLSLTRAGAMRDILVASGISAQLIQVIGRGELEPEVETADGVAEPRNRRVEITVR